MHKKNKKSMLNRRGNVKVNPSISSLMAECRKMYRLMSTYMQSYQISVIFKPIVKQFEQRIAALIADIECIHRHEDEEEKKDMTDAFHSLTMSIRFISDKLNRLN